MLCLNYNAFDARAPLYNWFGWFPIAMSIRPVMVCVLSLQPDRMIAVVSVIEGCLLTCNTLLRLQFLPAWMILPRLVSVVPAIMFTLTSALIAMFPTPLQTDSRGSVSKNLAIRITNAIFGSACPTLTFHNVRVSALVGAMRRPVIDSDSAASLAHLIDAPVPMSARMLTTTYLAFFWRCFALSFVFSALCQGMVVVFAFSANKLRTIVIICCFIFLLVFLYHAKNQLIVVKTTYCDMFWGIAQLCKKGFIPPIIQSSVSFQSAAKYTASETIRIVWDSLIGVLISFVPAFKIALVAFLILLAEYVLNLGLISKIVQLFSEQFFEALFENIRTVFFMLARPEVSAVLWIIILSKLFSSSWVSLFRLFGTEHLRIDIPKRVANCCCLQFRCVACSALAFISLVLGFTWHMSVRS
jgi:hypothetical protein